MKVKFKVGDKVRRHKDRQKEFNWPFGNEFYCSLHTMDEIREHLSTSGYEFAGNNTSFYSNPSLK